jgi:hypothetical protein
MMKPATGILANRLTVCLQRTASLVDLDVLQYPGGSFLALLLLLRAVATGAFDYTRTHDA